MSLNYSINNSTVFKLNMSMTTGTAAKTRLSTAAVVQVVHP